jgi:hypothetical protein
MAAEIVVDGDLVLVVGSGELKVLVHSLFLKAASKPFSAMLSPRWKEGRDMLEQDVPVELPLPDDNAEGLWLICAIIHHRNDLVPDVLEPGVVLEIAILADKYDFIEVLKFACEAWFRPRNNKDDILLIAAAYLLWNAQAFKELTKSMVLNHSGPYLTLLCEKVESAMSWRVFCKHVHNI